MFLVGFGLSARLASLIRLALASSPAYCLFFYDADTIQFHVANSHRIAEEYYNIHLFPALLVNVS
jgi:hypothetical protein